MAAIQPLSLNTGINNLAGSMTTGFAPLGPSGIIMDTSKAMAMLGFSPSQTFETTSSEEINRAYMFKMHLIISNGKRGNFNPRQKETRRQELRKINEALQFLTKKRTKGVHVDEWKRSGLKCNIVSKALNALTSDDGRLMSVQAYRETLLKAQMAKEKESKRALDLADELAKSLEGGDILSKSGSFIISKTVTHWDEILKKDAALRFLR